MYTHRVKNLVLVLSALVLHACNPEICARYCPNPQTLTLLDASGNPLTPLRVTDDVRVHDCTSEDGTSSAYVSCVDNRITFDQRDTAPYRIRIEATNGAIFEGDFTPKLEATGMTSQGCDCVRERRFTDQTVEFPAP